MYRCYACDALVRRRYINHGTPYILCPSCYDTILRKPRKYKTYEQRMERWRQATITRAKLYGGPCKGKQKRLPCKRECYACGRVSSPSAFGYQCWCHNKDDGGKTIHLLCQRCYHRIIFKPPKWPPGKDTVIEIKVQKLLTEKGITFDKHVYVLGCWPDLFIKPNVCIFADGDYWHGSIDKMLSDAAITQRLTEQGYKVLRFWERQIHGNIDAVWKTIKESCII